MVPFHMLGMVSYKCAILTLSVRRTVFKVLDFKNAVTLKPGLGVREVIENCHHSIESLLLPINVL